MHRVNPSYALNAVRTQAFDGSYQTLHINEREKFIYIYILAKGQLRKKTYMDKVKCIKKEDGKFIV
jgi:hypothetical protein